MSFLETILHTGLSLWNMWDQGKALIGTGNLEGNKEANKNAAIAFGAKTLQEYFAGRITGKEAIAKGVNDFADWKVTNALEEHGVSAPLAKALGLASGWLAEKLTKGIESGIFPDGQKTTIDDGTTKLAQTGKIDPNNPEPGLFDKFKDLMSGGKSVDGVSSPLPGGSSSGGGKNLLSSFFS